jgi:two-component system LytT family response regulator
MADIRALVVDDEPLARAGVRRMLDEVPDVTVVGEATNGAEAVDAVQRLKPDLLLLDIQMPEMNGFEVLNALDPDDFGAVIFITAYDTFAVRAFEVQALDYIMKPFDDERFFAVIDRAKKALVTGEDDGLSHRLASLLDTYEKRAGTHLSRIMVKDGGRIFFQPVDDIDWIESADYYSRLHVGTATHLIRESMSSLEEQLDPTRFIRIHRTAIVNADRVQELRLDYTNRHVVLLKNGTTLPLSRTRKETLERVMSGGA